MSSGVFYALMSMLFAGFTSVLAKFGLNGISSDVGTVVRTCFVLLFTLMIGFFTCSAKDFQALGKGNFLWLALSALTTAASWICYYRAIKLTDVAKVALIDKGSVIVAMLLAFIFLHEGLSPTKLGGAALVVLGLVVIAR